MINNIKDFNDQIFIEKIREKLWTGREIGKAAVMIGAGFSRNANPATPNTPLFPLWSDIAKKIYSLLGEENYLNNKEFNGLEFAKEAGKYEDLFGRKELESLLIEMMPDNSYNPGELHKLLLSLPWSDIFTTNYDTLLERTQPFIYERKYDVVYSKEDIPGKMKPRIIKLHGSFPSNRPFIITTKDYDEYAKNCAAFVNTVQQSIMENTFCLLGFSCQDPNFLKWCEWVNKNLGNSMPKIYLCGLLNISEEDKKDLNDDNNIITIDLSPLFPKENFSTNMERHYKAIEWFLLNLRNGEPPNNIYWPKVIVSKYPNITNYVPKIPPSPKQLSDNERSQPKGIGTSLNKAELEEIYLRWKQKREEYPDWVIPPFDSRKKLWDYTEYWINPIFDSLDILPIPKNLFLLYELVWRLKKSMFPIFEVWIERIKIIIDKINPFPELIDIDAEYNPRNKKYSDLNWERISENWVEVVFVLIKESRLDNNIDLLNELMDSVSKIVHKNVRWEAEWFYQKSLSCLNQFDIEGVRQLLDDWSILKDLPFYKVKKAAILAEIGFLNEAEKIAEEALEKIRLDMNPYPTNYLRFSQEGWTMLLLKCIKDNKLDRTKNYQENFLNRWEYLDKYYCDPWADLKSYTSEIRNMQISYDANEKIIKKFDPGRISISKHFRTGFIFNDRMPAFAFIKLFEECAFPISCGRLINFGKENVKTAIITMDYYFYNSFNLIIRTGQIKEIDSFFSRSFIAMVPEDKVRIINEKYLNVLECLVHIAGNNSKITNSFFFHRTIRILSEIVSRFLIRYSDQLLEKIFKLSSEMYRNDIFKKFHENHDCVFNMYKRLFNIAPQNMVIKNLNSLLDLPIPDENGFKVSMPQSWPEPFDFIRLDKINKKNKCENPEIPSSKIKYLISILNEGNPEARKRASIRLSSLYDCGILNKLQISSFADALWFRTNDQNKLPVGTCFYDSFFLHLPGALKNKAKNKLKKYILDNSFPRLVKKVKKNGKTSTSVSFGGNNTIIQNLSNSSIDIFNKDRDINNKLIKWTGNEISNLLIKAIEWWDDENKYLSDKKDDLYSIDGMLRKEFNILKRVLNKIIIPNLDKRRKDDINRLSKLIYEMDKKGFCILSTLPLLMLLGIMQKTEVLKKIRRGLNSILENEVKESIYGLFYWVAMGRIKRLNKPPKDLYNDLINIVLFRKQPGLNNAIIYLNIILKLVPEDFNDDQIEMICLALEYLIIETELPSFEYISIEKDIRKPVGIEERPEYRKISAELAYNVFEYLKNNNRKIPDVLFKWKEICNTDILPEVKRAWGNVL
ncbi:MAG: SIR2 family protein [Actinomycetota bacterium]|nr:SIR2 family protein [Actinomycetota bacterium]